MVARVEEDVAQGVADLARVAEDAGVVALGEQFARAAEGRVHPARQAHGEALHVHATGERRCVGGLDHEVDVVARTLNWTTRKSARWPPLRDPAANNLDTRSCRNGDIVGD